MSQIIIFAVISTDMLRCPGDRKIFLAEFFWRQYLEKKNSVWLGASVSVCSGTVVLGCPWPVSVFTLNCPKIRISRKQWLNYSSVPFHNAACCSKDDWIGAEKAFTEGHDLQSWGWMQKSSRVPGHTCCQQPAGIQVGFSVKAEPSEGSASEKDAEEVTRKSFSQQTCELAANERELQSALYWDEGRVFR